MKRILVLAAAGGLFGMSLPAASAPQVVALVKGTLVNGTGSTPVPGAVVLVQSGRVICAGAAASCPVPEGAEVHDLSGRWIIPGLVDAHVHFSQSGWADGRPDALDLRDRYPYPAVVARLRQHPERFFRADLCSGVTAVFDVGGYPWTLELSARVEEDLEAPHVVAAGPLLSTWDFWLNLPAEKQFLYLSEPDAARDAVGYLASRGSRAVKVWFIPVPDRPFEEMEAVVVAAGEDARQVGLPLIVHATGLAEAKVALRAGAALLVHSVMDTPIDDEFLDLAREAGATYCPTLTVFDGYRHLFSSVFAGSEPALDDPNHCIDTETRRLVAETSTLDPSLVDRQRFEERLESLEESQRTMAANLRKVSEAGIPVAMGTDAGNPLTLHGPSVYAEMEAMQAAGLTPMQVLVASTRNAAAAMGRGSDLGTVENGKVADLLVVDADPTVDIANLRRLHAVMRGGLLRLQEELRAR